MCGIHLWDFFIIFNLFVVCCAHQVVVCSSVIFRELFAQDVVSKIFILNNNTPNSFIFYFQQQYPKFLHFLFSTTTSQISSTDLNWNFIEIKGKMEGCKSFFEVLSVFFDVFFLFLLASPQGKDDRTWKEKVSDYFVNDGIKTVFIIIWVLANIAVFTERYYRKFKELKFQFNSFSWVYLFFFEQIIVAWIPTQDSQMHTPF